MMTAVFGIPGRPVFLGLFAGNCVCFVDKWEPADQLGSIEKIHFASRGSPPHLQSSLVLGVF